MARSFSLLLPFFATSSAFRFPLRTNTRLLSSSILSSDVTTAAAEEKFSVYVGNVPLEASEDELRSFFAEKLGTTTYSKLKIPLDRETQRPRGFLYLEFAAKNEAEVAVSSLTGLSVRDRALKVDFADPSRPKSERAERVKPVYDQESSVYVGNLAFGVTEEDLKGLCDSVLGPDKVSKIRIAIDRETNRARGFAHIDFTDKEAAAQAVAGLNGATLSDRAIRVDHAQRKDEVRQNFNTKDSSRPPRAFSQNQGGHSVFIGNLAWDMSTELVEEMVNDVLGEGLFTKVRLSVDRETGRSRGFGHIDFKDAESAERAISELNGMEVLGRQLRVDKAVRKEQESSGGFSGKGRGGGSRGGGRFNDNKDSDNYGSW